jgi:ubiquinone/menaquinone biosynthesis C-methylase UbiE
MGTERLHLKTPAAPAAVALPRPARRRALHLFPAAVCALAGTMAWAGAPRAVNAQTVHDHKHGFSGAHEWLKVLEDPTRDAWQKPHEVIQALALKPDAVVADIGAGTGYFAIRLSHKVPKGRVYAVDSEPDMVKHLADRAAKGGLKNLRPVLASADDPKLPGEVDLVLLVNVFHHIENRDRWFRRLQDSLRSGARVAIIDFNLESPEGPPKAARVPVKQVRAELEKAGYRLAREHGFLPNQFFLEFTPGKR